MMGQDYDPEITEELSGSYLWADAIWGWSSGNVTDEV